jgi:major membrane immunogen (membrane-anchored lipoprotein)
MSKTLLLLGACILFAFSDNRPYRDGSYSGTSRARYIDEPYYGTTRIIIENGKIVNVAFQVTDSAKKELFDDQYERYFAGNELYIKQCRNDRKGIQSYPDSLLKYQDLEKVDAISGATWSYEIFKASAEEALKQAMEIPGKEPGVH